MPINCPETRMQCDRECSDRCKLREQQEAERKRDEEAMLAATAALLVTTAS